MPPSAWVALAVVLCGFNVSAGLLPLTKGTQWTYFGTVAWDDHGKYRSRNLVFKVEVMEAVQRGRYQVAMIRGWPSDLAFSDETVNVRCHLAVLKDGKEFYLSDSEDCSLPAEGPADPNSQSQMWGASMKTGDLFGADPSHPRDDRFYAWSVDDVKTSADNTTYSLSYRTIGSHEFLTYVSGVGLTSYVYGHHGTLSEVDMKLTRLTVGGGRKR